METAKGKDKAKTDGSDSENANREGSHSLEKNRPGRDKRQKNMKSYIWILYLFNSEEHKSHRTN